jgi:hypothetical protein
MGVVEIMDKHLGTIIFVGMVLAALVAGGISTARDTTTLDDATNRTATFRKYVDKENGVVCYYRQRGAHISKHFECVQVTPSRHHAK